MESLQLSSGAESTAGAERNEVGSDAREEEFDEDANAAWRDAQLRVIGLVPRLQHAQDFSMGALRDLQAMTGADASTGDVPSGFPPTAS